MLIQEHVLLDVKYFEDIGGQHILNILTILSVLFFWQVDYNCRMSNETRQFPHGWPFLSSEVRQLWGLLFIYVDFFIPSNTKTWFEPVFQSKGTWQFKWCVWSEEKNITYEAFLEEHWTNPFFKTGFFSLFTVRWLNNSNEKQNWLFKGFFYIETLQIQNCSSSICYSPKS